MPPNNLFVLDTSALLALRGDEPGADRVEGLLLRARNKQCRLLISFISRMELLYTVWRKEGEEAGRDALRLADSFEVEWVSCEPEILELAARLKAQGRLSLAGSWIAGIALSRDATLIHKDPEFAGFKEIPRSFSDDSQTAHRKEGLMGIDLFKRVALKANPAGDPLVNAKYGLRSFTPR